MNIRIIPRLDVKGSNVVKGVHLEGLRVVGSPSEYAKAYYASGADEILYMDSVASLYGRNNLHNIVAEAADSTFIPLTVGGGIRSVEDAKKLLRAGADKVAINTALFSNPTLINEIVDDFGSQCMVVSIDVVKIEGKYECLTDGGRERTGVEADRWIEEVVNRGAGEILLTSVDKEGTGKGYDIELVHNVTRNTPIPVVACGGAGCKEDVGAVLEQANADAVSAASIFHYYLLRNMQEKFNEKEGNLDFIKKASSVEGSLRTGIEPISITDLKMYLSSQGKDVRTSGF